MDIKLITKPLMVKTQQRVEKLLHAPFCVPFKGLKPCSCSVLVLVPECFDSVLGFRPVAHRLFQQARKLRSLRSTSGGRNLAIWAIPYDSFCW